MEAECSLCEEGREWDNLPFSMEIVSGATVSAKKVLQWDAANSDISLWLRNCLCVNCHHNASVAVAAGVETFPLAIHSAVPFIAILTPQREELSSEQGHAEDCDNADAACTTTKSLGTPPENFLTRQEMCRILLLCGVKSHRCPEAVQQLWVFFLVLCYNVSLECDGVNGEQNRGCIARNTNLTSGAKDFAMVVRYVDLRCVMHSPARTLEGAWKTRAVGVLELVVAAAALQRDGVGSGGGGEPPRATEQATSPSGYTLVVARHTFDRCITKLLSRELRGHRITLSPLPRWNVAQAIVQHRKPFVVFFGGTSGCGKSTLSSLITSHLCMGALLSTDTIRQVLRRTLRREEFPELFVSTYEAHRGGASSRDEPTTSTHASLLISATGKEKEEEMEDPQLIVEAYEKQCAAVLRALDGMLEKFIARNQAVVVEGAHLLTSYMHRKSAELLARGVMCVPFVVSITKEQCHMQRFCTRAKSMTLSPHSNKYVSHFRYIRLIQQHLLNQARELNVSVVNNTNVDKSLMLVHTRLLDAMDHDTLTVWSGQRVGIASDTHTEDSLAPSTSDPAQGLPPGCMNKNEHGSGEHLYNKFADPSISGKRMLALLHSWRSEKTKKRGLGNASQMAEGSCGCCARTNFFTQAKRARSAESLSSFQLQLLSVHSFIQDMGHGLHSAAVVKSPSKHGEKGELDGDWMVAGAPDRMLHKNNAMSLESTLITTQQKGEEIFLQQPQMNLFKSMREQLPPNAVTSTAANLHPATVAAAPTTAEIRWRGRAPRSASVDGGGGETDTSGEKHVNLGISCKKKTCNLS